MNIEFLRDNIEKLAEAVHDAWWKEKERQGYHAPFTHAVSGKFSRLCDKCHPDMYPYGELSEYAKEHSREPVRAVLDAISALGEEGEE